jgi:hypothetical protein
MTISSVSFSPSSGESVMFYQFYMYMGYCADSELGTVYDDNYISGTRTSVISNTGGYSLTSATPWTGLPLDTPFFFDPAAGNLIIEIAWPDGEGEIYTFDHATAGVSMVSSGYGQSSGDTFTQGPYLLLEGAYSLEQVTFAGIKASFL